MPSHAATAFGLEMHYADEEVQAAYLPGGWQGTQPLVYALDQIQELGLVQHSVLINGVHGKRRRLAAVLCHLLLHQPAKSSGPSPPAEQTGRTLATLTAVH